MGFSLPGLAIPTPGNRYALPRVIVSINGGSYGFTSNDQGTYGSRRLRRRSCGNRGSLGRPRHGEADQGRSRGGWRAPLHSARVGRPCRNEGPPQAIRRRGQGALEERALKAMLVEAPQPDTAPT